MQAALVLSCLMGALLLGGCATTYNPGTAQEELIWITTDKEVRMGAGVARQIAEGASDEFKLSYDPKTLARIDRIGARLAAVSERKELTFKFHLLEWDKVNAFAVPGGYIYVSSALVDLAESDDELASVIAHEISHVVAKHSVKRIQGAYSASILQALIAFGTKDAKAMRGTQAALGHLFLAHSRQDEFQADTIGIRYMKAAGFNPEASLIFLKRMQLHFRKKAARRFSYLRTHPHFDDRIRAVKQAVRGQVEFEDYINRDLQDL